MTARKKSGHASRCDYEGVEAPANFPSRLELEQYRALLLRKTAAQVEFIRRKLTPRGRKLRVLEFCCGNGRLLVALAQAGLVEYGLGIDLAASRIGFARDWVAELGLRQVEFRNEDVLQVEAPQRSFDLAVCLTGAFQYFRPISAAAPAKVLSRLHAGLATGGRVLLELYPLAPKMRRMFALNGNHLRTWDPLPPEDRFAYYLHERQYWPKRGIVRHQKTFIGRDGAIDAGRTETLAYYNRAQIGTMLRKSGFGSVQFLRGFEAARRSDSLLARGVKS
ncbi:MAG TPA: class I SAM-dependent methyltransferase [Terriglobales bacterium]|nr:class I SAM-dependent methyltransferase [Terriglobales bacterium]